MNPILHLQLENPYGGLTQHTAYDLKELLHLLKIEPPTPGLDTFDSCIDRMKMRDERRRRFEGIGRMLGALMAERMEDAEGWHGIERQIKMAELEKRKKEHGGY